MDAVVPGRSLAERAREVVDAIVRPRAAEWDRTESYPWPVVRALTDAGFMGMTVPEVYGGPGRPISDVVVIIEEIGKACALSARIVVEANMGAISAILAYGTERQKRLAAPYVLAGDKPAICITEPGAGSAATEMTTRADRKGDRYILNGEKHWITGGGVSRLHLIFARVFDEQGAEQGIGGFIVIRDPDKGLEPRGLTIAGREATMGLRGMPEARIVIENLEGPEGMVLRPPSGFRRGFPDLMNAYNTQRVGAATVALGVATGAFELARDWTKAREQFGRPIAEFQGVQWMLADMAIGLESARAMIHRAAESKGPGGSPFPDPIAAAMAKVVASETAIKVTNEALQLFGARGYSRDLPLERMVRDARMFTIGGGTAQILRTLVAADILQMKLPQTRDGYVRAGQSLTRETD
jgi:alkylation response protein AidB-like acyl-CoA dehydrogenase